MKAPRYLPAFRAAAFVTLCSCLVLNAWGAASSNSSSDSRDTQASVATVVIPGPLRSFLRMAGISQKISPEEVMPLLARNTFLLGYEGAPPRVRPTEFLILLSRYVQQARELATLAGPEGVIRVSSCEQARPLLQVLGYRERQDCGQGTSYLETADPQRAFLTIDSGFPLPDLERALQGGKPFAYNFGATHVPILFSEDDWAKRENNRNLVDALMRDTNLARLYWAFSRIDTETRAALHQSPGIRKLAPYSPVLDFYGSRLRIRSGRVLVPGGQPAEATWKELVGASPESAGDFVFHLMSKDSGWLAAYFDALSRTNQFQQAHFTEPHHMKRYYEALRRQDTTGAARSVFRPAPGLLLLLTRLQWEANGDPHIPGNVEVWKRTFHQKPYSDIAKDWGKRAGSWNNPEQLLEAMFALSRIDTDSGPVQAFLALSELDSRRGPGKQLSPDTVALLASRFPKFGDQYLIFSEFSRLDDASIVEFINTAEHLSNIPNHYVRGNALGTFQATVGIWQILARQEEIPKTELNASWQKTIRPFGKIASSTDAYDAGRAGLKEVIVAATGKPTASQDELIDILAGPPQNTPEGQRIRQEVANRIRAALDGQRLVSLDALLFLGDSMHDVGRVKAENAALTNMAGELREFEMPQPIFKNSERDEWGAGIYNNRHTDLEMKTDISKVITSPTSPQQLAEARGQLSPFLRDALVGLNYAYYEPPGSQILHHNPLFVRSHDFSGDTVVGLQRVWKSPQLFGAGTPAGGGAHLVGSLADLPYVLSEAEQDFITPENVQALIWGAVVPGLMTSAIVPRWWNVTPNELHTVSLYQQAGEDLLRTAAGNDQLRGKLTDILSARMAPQTLERVDQALRTSHATDIIARLTPADTFYLAIEFQRRFPEQIDAMGQPGKDLQNIAQSSPDDVGWERLSRDFGVPHPVLAQSYARELLNLPPFPAFMGYSSRFLAESWDSNNLYWARLADEKGYSPVMLNRLVPELTHRMVEKIFATDVEDWPALLRATRETGDEFRQGKVAVLPAPNHVASLH
jgi:hypothetical protein